MANNSITYYVNIDPTGAVTGSEKTIKQFEAIDESVEGARNELAGFYRDSSGRLRDSKGRFVKTSKDIATGIDDIGESAHGSGVSTIALGNVLADFATRAVEQLAMLPGKIFTLATESEETESKFNTVMGSMSGETQAFLDQFATMAGLTRSQGQEVVATAGSIAQGLGFSTQASSNLAIEVTKLAGDLQSFNNVPIEQTSNAITSALTGEREALKSLGIVINEADVQKKALITTGKESADSLTQQEKAAATLALITERAGVAVGDLERTQFSAANQARALQAEVGTIAEEISRAFLPSIGLAIAGVREFMNLDIFQSLIEGAERSAQVLEFLLTNIEALAPIALGAGTAIGLLALYHNRSAIAAQLHALYTQRAAMAQALLTGGIGLLVAALGALVALVFTNADAMNGLGLVWEGFMDLVTIVFRNLPVVARDAMRVLWEILQLPPTLMQNYWKSVFEAVTSNFSLFIQAFKQLVSGDFDAAWDTMQQIGENSLNAFKDNFEGTLEGVQGSIDALTTNTDFSPATAKMAQGGKALATAVSESFTNNLDFSAFKTTVDATVNSATNTATNETASLVSDEDINAQMSADTKALDGIDADMSMNIDTEAIKAATEAERQLQTAMEESIDLVDKRRMANAQAHIEQTQQQLALTESSFKQGQQLIQNEKNVAKATIEGVKQAIVTRINEGVAGAVAKTLASVPFPLNIPLGIAAGAASRALLSQFLPFKTGGKIPGEEKLIRVNEEGEEFVINAESTRENSAFLEKLNSDSSYVDKLLSVERESAQKEVISALSARETNNVERDQFSSNEKVQALNSLVNQDRSSVEKSASREQISASEKVQALNSLVSSDLGSETNNVTSEQISANEKVQALNSLVNQDRSSVEKSASREQISASEKVQALNSLVSSDLGSETNNVTSEQISANEKVQALSNLVSSVRNSESSNESNINVVVSQIDDERIDQGLLGDRQKVNLREKTDLLLRKEEGETESNEEGKNRIQDTLSYSNTLYNSSTGTERKVYEALFRAYESKQRAIGRQLIRVSNGEYYVEKEKAQENLAMLSIINEDPQLLQTGMIAGEGSEQSDSIVGFAELGSFVVNAQSTRNMAPVLERAFSEGGLVGSSIDKSSMVRQVFTPTSDDRALEAILERLENIEVRVRGEIEGEDLQLVNSRKATYDQNTKVLF